MSMTQITAALYQLQQIDLDLERLLAEQQAVTQSLQANAKLQKARQEHAVAQQQLQIGLQAQKEAEWALEELNRRLALQEQRLYNGAVTNPKDLYALQQEVQHLRGQQSRQEDMALEVMDAADTLQEAARLKAETLAQTELDWQQESATMLARRDQLDVRKQELQSKRAQMVASIAAEYITRYEAMRRTKQGRAVSKVEQNSCQWCRVILTPSDLQRVRVSADLQTCTNCGRILYYDR
jgi:predicted  nucleic acid-binding Zn-ribbon protein